MKNNVTGLHYPGPLLPFVHPLSPLLLATNMTGAFIKRLSSSLLPLIDGVI